MHLSLYACIFTLAHCKPRRPSPNPLSLFGPATVGHTMRGQLHHKHDCFEAHHADSNLYATSMRQDSFLTNLPGGLSRHSRRTISPAYRICKIAYEVLSSGVTTQHVHPRAPTYLRKFLLHQILPNAHALVIAHIRFGALEPACFLAINTQQCMCVPSVISLHGAIRHYENFQYSDAVFLRSRVFGFSGFRVCFRVE